MLDQTIQSLLPQVEKISLERKIILDKVVAFIQHQKKQNEPINLVFICTHNSRRSHFTQVWAQAAAHYFGIEHFFCYSGGTEVTAMFPLVHQTLAKNGFLVQPLSSEKNPVYALKYDDNKHPILCFSKKYDDDFNPKTNFLAVMTCTDAEKNCPFIPTAKQRIALPYNDPKEFDNTTLQQEKYDETSLEIAKEMLYICSKIK